MSKTASTNTKEGINGMDDNEKLFKQAIAHFSYGVSHDIFSESVATYAKLAVEALERQLSKKPYWETYEGWHCKSCGVGVFGDESFCPFCGQAIDWRGD